MTTLLCAISLGSDLEQRPLALRLLQTGIYNAVHQWRKLCGRNNCVQQIIRCYLRLQTNC